MKKAQFFTIVIILLLSIYLVGFTYINYEKYRTKAYSVQSRVNSVNWFINDIHQDLENVLYISSTRATIALMQEVLDERNYIKDYNTAYKDLIVYGKLNGENNRFLEENTLLNWTNKAKEVADDLDIEIKFSNYEVEVYQIDPWFIKIDLTTNIYIKDNKNTSWWNQTITKTAQMDIDEVLEDPLYRIKSNGTITRIIKKTNIKNFVIYAGIPPDVSDLQRFAQEKHYRHSNSSPSYLMRLQGNFSSSECCGIESLVSVQEISEHTFFNMERSHVDYLYWKNPSQPQISGIDFWYIDHTAGEKSTMIRIDNQSNHLAEYNVTDIILI